MTDERPRPRYGEYASPEQQVEAGGFAPPNPETVQPATAPPGAAASEAPTRPRARRPWDVLLTSALLGVGIFIVITTSFAYLNMAEVARQAFAVQGFDPYTSDATAQALGILLVIVQGVVLLAAIVLSVLSLRRDRVTFWIPLTGGVLVGIVSVVVYLAVMLVDPAFAPVPPA